MGCGRSSVGGAYSSPSDPLTGFGEEREVKEKKGRGGEGRKNDGKRRGGEGKGRTPKQKSWLRPLPQAVEPVDAYNTAGFCDV